MCFVAKIRQIKDEKNRCMFEFNCIDHKCFDHEEELSLHNNHPIIINLLNTQYNSLSFS
jgi:hypothetical protein